MKRIRRNYSFPDQVYDRLKVLANALTYGNRSAALAILVDTAWKEMQPKRGKK